MAEDLLFDLLHTEIVNQMYDNASTNNEQVFSCNLPVYRCDTPTLS